MVGDSVHPTFAKRAIKAGLFAAIPIFVAFLLGSTVSRDPVGMTYVGAQGGSQFLQTLFLDIGIAILIAWAVKEMIESDYERRQQIAMAAGADASRRAVLRALFASFFDDETVEEVYRTIFSSTLIRKGMTVTYKISPHPKSAWLVKFETTLEYTITNIATVTAHFDPGTVVGNYAAIFREDVGLSAPKLKSAKFGGKRLSKAEVDALNARVNRTDAQARFPFETHKMKAGDALHVRIVHEREKLICDAEVMRMSYPTKKVTVEVQNGCAPGLEIQVSEIGQQGFTPKDAIEPDETRWKCVHEGILLENNGWVLYWNDTRLRPTEIAGPRPGTPEQA